jgi:alkylated DNA repair dioxygenase AlkB
MAMRGVVERPDGFTYWTEVLTFDEEAGLLEVFASLETKPVVMHGLASRRRVCHFGAGYDFDTWTTTRAEPIPDYLLDLRTRCAALAAVESSTFAEALVTWYPPGATIGWHRDAAVFGAVVVGVSLGSQCALRFQRRAAKGERRVFEQPLAARSAYVLTGAARAVWQHSVPSVPDDRWSVTFRQLRRKAAT